MTAPDVFRRVVGALDAAGIPYMLTCSFASAYHAVPRATQDIDIVIAPDRGRLAELARTFSAAAYYCDADAALDALERESLFNVIDLATGLEDRSHHPQVARVQPHRVRPPPARRTRWELGESGRQLEGVAWLLRRRGDDLDRAYIDRWVRELQVRDQWHAACRLAEKLP